MKIGTKYKILSIDEEKEVQHFYKRIFLQKGCKFYSAQSGKEGIAQIVSNCPDLVLLDLILPDMEGMDLLVKIRELSDCPVIIVSSREKESDKVTALDAGADDYVTKPFGHEELMARIRCALRYRRKYGDKNIYLAMNSGKMVTYQRLLEKIWGPYASESNKILRVNMTNIRRKICDSPAEPKYIFTESGVGYRMAESVESPERGAFVSL